MANIDGTSGPDDLVGTGSDDLIRGFGGNDRLRGLAGNDRLEGGEGDDILEGGEGADDLVGGAGVDGLYGQAGDDIYRVLDAGDFVHEAAGEGNDVVYTAVDYTLLPGMHVERVSSIDWRLTTALRLAGNEFANLIEGNAGNNFLDGRADADRLVGFGGDDVYLVDNAGDVVVEYGDTTSELGRTRYGIDTVYASIDYTLAPGSFVEVLAASDRDAVTTLHLTGNELDNLIEGDAGANVLNGAGGSDILSGFGGDDLYIVSGGEIIVEGAGGGNDLAYALNDYVLSAGSQVERLSGISWALTTPLKLTGNELANLIEGNAGNNVLDGAGGADRLVGFGGDDQYRVDNAGDVVIELSGAGADTVITQVDYALTPGSHIELLITSSPSGSLPIRLTGNELVNRIEGNAGPNLLDGRGGADTMVGLGGSDQYVVDNAGDVVVEVGGGSGSDTVSTLVDYTLPANAGVERLTSISWALTTPLRLTGNEHANLIEGNAGDNYLDGKAGLDKLYGFGGADTFAFSTTIGPPNLDRIMDFEPGIDTIALAVAAFHSLAPGPLPATAFRLGTDAQDADDRILYDSTYGLLQFDPDGTGPAGAEPFARVTAGLVLTASDFLVI